MEKLKKGQNPRKALTSHKERGPKKYTYTVVDVCTLARCKAEAVNRDLKKTKVESESGQSQAAALLSRVVGIVIKSRLQLYSTPLPDGAVSKLFLSPLREEDLKWETDGPRKPTPSLEKLQERWDGRWPRLDLYWCAFPGCVQDRFVVGMPGYCERHGSAVAWMYELEGLYSRGLYACELLGIAKPGEILYKDGNPWNCRVDNLVRRKDQLPAKGVWMAVQPSVFGSMCTACGKPGRWIHPEGFVACQECRPESSGLPKVSELEETTLTDLNSILDLPPVGVPNNSFVESIRSSLDTENQEADAIVAKPLISSTASINHDDKTIKTIGLFTRLREVLIKSLDLGVSTDVFMPAETFNFSKMDPSGMDFDTLLKGVGWAIKVICCIIESPGTLSETVTKLRYALQMEAPVISKLNLFDGHDFRTSYGRTTLQLLG
jgi:hypothetical protein